MAQSRLLDGSGYRKFKEVIAAQGGNPKVLDQFELLPNATGAQEITTQRAGYVSAIDAELIGQASSMIGAGRNTKEDNIDPAVGVILEVKVGQKIDAGGILCRIYHTSDEHLAEAAELLEDAFKIANQAVEERDLNSRSCELTGQRWRDSLVSSAFSQSFYPPISSLRIDPLFKGGSFSGVSFFNSLLLLLF